MTRHRSAPSRIFGIMLAALAPATTGYADEYRIDESHSFIQFRAKHLGFSWVVGRFNEFSGSFSYDPDGVVDAQKANVRIDIESLDTNHAERDRHLLSDDFLDAGNHPDASFESTSFTGDSSGGVLEGNFTLHGVTNPIQITVTAIGEGDDPWGGYRAGFEGRSRISAGDYQIDHPVVDEVELDLFVEGIRE